MLVEEAHTALHKSQESQACNYNEKHMPMEFAVGDLVMLSMQNLNLTGNHKFKPCFVGPFPITQHIGSQAYFLQLPASLLLHNIFHIGLLEPYYARGNGCITPALI